LVVDTDVVAAALLGQPQRGAEAARLLVAADELWAPSHWTAEFANVIWKTVWLGHLEPTNADVVLEAAQRLPIASVDVTSLWKGAVARGLARQHPVYDTLFVELAVRKAIPMASYDQKLRRKFPRLVRSPRSLLDQRP
jgi:predicted nucleic acid-binding protein